MSHFQSETKPGVGKPPFCRFSCAIVYGLFDLSYKANWPSWPKPPIFKVKRTPEQVNPSFCRFSCAIVYGLLGDIEF
ncbi:hypothetical protein H5410_044064 [Solanum commersonii]|uniref:Uncharacterized protein n=1 Tax=Solanum commersonii TaxID=4109 RepID=A0A9J5Y355_SOLCO|nr:hypothetical protein H5410_044064 [Solanum commersonii]